MRRMIGGAFALMVALAVYPLWRTFTIYRADLAMQSVTLPAAPSIQSSDRVLVLSPHLDDETLGAGGTIARAKAQGARVRVVFFTNGDGSTSTIAAENLHARRPSYVQMAQMRQREAVAALAELGVKRADLLFLGYPDGGLQTLWEDHWNSDFRSPTTGFNHSPYSNSFSPRAPYRGAQVFKDVTRVMEEFRPTQLFTTHPADTHPDHWAAFAFTSAALETLRARPASQRWAATSHLCGFLVHHGVWPVPHGYHPDLPLSIPAAQQHQNSRWTSRDLSAAEQKQKTRALDRYASQLVWTPLYLRAFLRRNEPFGSVAQRAISGQSTLKAPQSTLLLSDEPNDNIRQTRRAGTDLRAISVRSQSDGLRFSLQLGGAPVADADYKLCLHAIENNSVPLNLHASGGEKTSQSKGASLSFWVSWKTLGAMRPRTLLVSATIRSGALVLDQSETATLHLK